MDCMDCMDLLMNCMITILLYEMYDYYIVIFGVNRFYHIYKTSVIINTIIILTISI